MHEGNGARLITFFIKPADLMWFCSQVFLLPVFGLVFFSVSVTVQLLWEEKFPDSVFAK